MWVDPPNRLNTLPLGSWLSQMTAGGQRSGLAFLCPNPPWVPTYPLSRGSPSPVTHATGAGSIFLSISVFFPHPTNHLALLLQATVSRFIPLCYFFHPFLCLLSLFCSFATIIYGQQLSWRAWKGSNPPLFLLLLSFPPSLPPFLPPCPVPCRGTGGISLPSSSWGRLHLSQGFPLKRHFSPLETCSLPTVTLSA